ncbi:DUF1543 domain-containing protein [Taibaiella koreensis]|uniref:DUF1543 domain-containing protein n=1 Tax=Taibaiella koreensis TaxID=1268548 RepID=UPI000E59CA15|nr:DUF1543 domain-containing protein [Taibaiella koreensis]
MEPLYLHMAIVGCTPPGRFTEQHDVFFGIGPNMPALIPELLQFWPEAEGRLHIDAWRRVTCVDGHHITVGPAHGITEMATGSTLKLFFLNLGGYRPGEFEEYHYKMLVAATDQGKAIRQAKETAFYKHSGFKGAESHVDDKYGVDVDDVHAIRDILDKRYKEQYRIVLTEKENLPVDELHIGYFKLDKL